MKKSDITRQKISEVAEEAFAEKGFYGARIDEIAQRAGVNKRMIYVHYKSKEQLYICVLNNVYQRLSQLEARVLSSQSDPICAVREMIRHDFEFLSDNPSFVKMILWENLNEAKFMKQSDALALKRTSINALRETLHRGVRNGVFRKDLDADECIFLINMLCFSHFSNIYTMSHIMGKAFDRKDETAKRCEHITNMILGDITAQHT